MKWYSLAFNAGREEDLHLVLRAGWTIAYADEPRSFRSGIFRGRAEAEGSIVYFSPGAHELAEAFGANPCGAPCIEGLTLVVGDKRTWVACFSERPNRMTGTLKLPKRIPHVASDDFPSTFVMPLA